MRDRTFLALCGLILVNQIGFGLITPVMPDYARSFGLGAGEVGLVIGIYGLARFFANVPAGQLSERLGRRSVMILGCAIASVASILIATASNLLQLLLYRLLAGTGAAIVVTTGQIMVGDLATTDNRGRLMSMYQGFFLIGVGLGPTPGGLLADHLGLRAPFLAYAAFSTAACGVALLFIRETRPQAPETDRGHNGNATVTEVETAVPLRTIAWSSGFLLIGAVSFVQTWARTGVLFTVVPLLAKSRQGLSSSQIGIGMTLVNVLNVATLYHAGTLSDRLGRKWVIVPATFISALGAALYAVGGSFALFLVSSSVWGAGSGLAGPSPAAYVADLAPAAQRGRVFGLYRTIADAGYVAGPLVLGWMAGVWGYGTPLLLTVAMFVGTGALFARFAPETRRQSPATALRSGAAPAVLAEGKAVPDTP